MGLLTVKDGSNNPVIYDLEGAGSSGDPFRPKSPTLLGENNSSPASSPSAVATLSSVLRGFWQSYNDRLFQESAIPSVVNLTTTLAVVMTIDVRRFNFCSIEITNGATALAECVISAQYHSGSPNWNPKTFGAAEYTTGSGKQSGNALISIIEASGNLNLLTANTSGWVEINCSRFSAIRISARVGAGTGTIPSCRAICK